MSSESNLYHWEVMRALSDMLSSALCNSLTIPRNYPNIFATTQWILQKPGPNSLESTLLSWKQKSQ
jgi:hypothetical protein